MKHFLLLLIFVCNLVSATITTPYPETILLKQINSAEKERVRLAQGMKKFDQQPTGFYIESGKTIVINVEILTPAVDAALPTLTVGTLGFDVDGRMRTEFKLSTGENKIVAPHNGLIFLSFITDDPREPVGETQITFTAESQHIRAPHYIYGITTDDEFNEMMDTYKTPDVVFHSDYVVVGATRDAAYLYSRNQKKNDWMNDLHTLLEKEDGISGMDNNDPNPLHHRLKAGEVRFLLVQNTSASPHASSSGYTGYPSSSVPRYLTIFSTGNNSWMVGHELGHQHQQPAYQINMATESTVNIYSYVVERNIQGATYNRTTAARWKQAQDTYLSLPVSKRVYDMPDAQLEGITGFNRDELRFMPWEQFFLIFGDQFYKTLHRVVREEKITGGGADERRAYLIWKASQVSGYDLTDYFNRWGIRVTDSQLKAQLRARIYTALQRGNIVSLPRPASDLVMITGQQLPAWAPLPLKGITSSAPQAERLNRSDWTVTTSINGVPDAVIGGTDPNYMIDGSLTTAFSFIKPGKTYEGVTGPSDYIPSFIIDMKKKNELNYFIYRHRTANNNSEFIRARKIAVYGKNFEEESFTPIAENIVIDPVENKDEIKVNFSKVEYRYLQVIIKDWNQTSGSTIQISDFAAGVENQEYLLSPTPYQYKVNVQAGEGVVTSQAGELTVNEDSNLTVEFTLLPGYENPVVTFDGDPIEPVKTGGVFTVQVQVTNHNIISLSSSKTTGVNNPDIPLIKVYPNPVKTGQTLTVETSNTLKTSGKWILYSSDGKKLRQKTLNSGIERITMNCKPGVYFIKIIAEKEITYKIIID